MHRTWEVEDGLPQDWVSAIEQTDDGYLWLGTQRGLVRFDGVSFKVFDKSNLDILGSNQILALLEGSDGSLWIGTTGGGLIRYRDGNFTAYTEEDGLAGNIVKTIHEDQRGRLWVGSVTGLSQLHNGSIRTEPFTDWFRGDIVLSITDTPGGTIWIGTDEGLFRAHEGKAISFDKEDAFEGKEIMSLHYSSDESLWIGTHQNGLARLTSGQLEWFTKEDGLAGNAVSTLYQDRAGALWIGTLRSGLSRYYGGKFSSFSRRNGLSHNKIRAIFQDREKNLWIGTEGGGLNQLRDSQFSTYGKPEGIASEVVLTVLETSDRDMWIGTEAGLNQMTADTVYTYTKNDGLPSNWIYALLEDRDGQLWVGTYGGGLSRMENGSFVSYSEEDGLSSNNIYSLEQTQDGAIWAGTERGLTRLSNGNVQMFGFDEGLTHNLITALHEDREGRLWIGTYGGGLSLYANGTFQNFGSAEGLSSGTILAIEEDERGHLWIGTAGGGLCRREKETAFRCYTSSDGLFSDDILQVLVDDRGYLWLGTLKGFNRVHRDSLLTYNWPDTTKLLGRTYGSSDGLRSSEANGGTQPPAWKASDGKLWFSTMKGVAVVNPLRAPVNTTPPLVKIEHLVLDGTTRGPDQSTIPPDNRMLEIDYTALSFVAPSKVSFQYKLDGLQKNWQDVGTRRRAYYSNLPAGNYKFKVRATNSDGVVSETAATASFRVQPYFYETRWFYLLLGIALVGGTGLAYRLRIRHLRSQREELSHRVEEKTTELRQRERELKSLNKDLEEEVQRKVDIILDERRRYERQLIEAKKEAEESARLKTNIINNMSHEIRTPLTSILGFTDMLAENVRPDQEELVEYVRKSGERLLETLDSVLDLAKVRSGNMNLNTERMDIVDEIKQIIETHRPKAEKKGLELRFQPSTDCLHVELEPSCIHRIVNNLVENAVKFTKEGYVRVTVTNRSDRVRITVEDTGIGISESFMPELFQEFKQESSGNARSHRGTGLGLALTRNLVEIMDGSIDVESEQGKGTRFTITLPRTLEDKNPDRIENDQLALQRSRRQ